MINAGAGLCDVPTAALKRALLALHKGDLRCPISIEELTRNGLQYVATDLLSLLRGLDAVAVRAILVAVLAERSPANRDRRLRAEAGLTGS
jgi:hypothetical protein